MLNAESKTKMIAFLKTLGIKKPEYDGMLSELNRRPVYRAPDAQAAVAAIEAALPGCKHQQYAEEHHQMHVFHLEGLGSIRIGVHVVYPNSSSPVWVRNYN